MTIQVLDRQIILTGSCGVEEAEALLAGLVDNPSRVVVIEAARAHTALWQVLMAIRPRVEGRPADTFVAQCILPLMAPLEAAKADDAHNPEQRRS